MLCLCLASDLLCSSSAPGATPRAGMDLGAAGPLCLAPWSRPWRFWQPGLALGMRGHSWGCLFPLAWESLLALPWVREQRAQRGVRSWVGCRGTPAGFEVFPFADGSEVRFRVCQGAARQTDLPWLSARGCGTVPRSPHSPNLGGISNGQRREP